jgi:cell division protease FtsH
MQATDIARSMITRYGMGENFTNVSLDKRGSAYLGGDQPYGAGREYSEETQRQIDQEITQIISDRYKTVKELLLKHKNLLEQVTEKLMDKETIEREELMSLIDNDEVARTEYEQRKEKDLKPSERAKVSGDARNEAIKQRMAKRRAEEEERARKAAEERAARERDVPGGAPGNSAGNFEKDKSAGRESSNGGSSDNDSSGSDGSADNTDSSGSEDS